VVEDQVVLVAAVLVVITQVVLVLMVLRHSMHIAETLHQVQHNILFVLLQQLDVHVVDVVLEEMVVDSVVAQLMYKVLD
jgi:hypothetical protein